jgi:Zn-dependent protease
MRRYRVTILRVAGIPIQLDVSWIVIAIVLTWSLALTFAHMFPLDEHPGWTGSTYWSMAGMAAIGTFVCLILHELGHALVARRFGIRIRSITLFIFGGVAELEQEPPSAQSEFWMAVGGPAVSAALAGGFWLLAAVGGPADWAVPVLGVVRHLALLNLALVGFNLVPAFPLDGGRVLRSILWAVFGDLRRATAVTTQMGQYFGGALLVLGLLSALAGFLLPGLWWMMLGWFLQSAAQSSYAQVVVHGLLAGQPVRRFMTTTVSSVPPELDVEQLVEQYVYQQHHRIYPVRTNGRLLGYVTPREIKQVPRAEWPRHRVAEIMADDLAAVQIGPDADAMEALSQMQRMGQTRLLVVERGSLVGILTLKDLLDFLSLKIELEES